MKDMVLRIERGGRVLGEWSLGDGPLSLGLRDRTTGATLAVFTASAASEVPAPAVKLVVAQPAPGPEVMPVAVSAPARSHTLVPELEASPAAASSRTSRSSGASPGASLVGAAAQGATPQGAAGAASSLGAANNEDTLVRRRPAALDFSDTTRPLELDPDPHPGDLLGLRGLNDEVPLGGELLGPLVRAPGDDFTMPLPDATTGPVSLRDAESLTSELIAVDDELEEESPGPMRAGLRVDPEAPTQRGGRAEVWSHRNGSWALLGTLNVGQQARLREGSVRCMDGGVLMVSPGPWLGGVADLPNGEQLQFEPGRRPMKLPAGASVTLWDGERGLYVRSEFAA